RRHRAARQALGQHEQPQLRGASGRGGADDPREPDHGGGRGGQGRGRRPARAARLTGAQEHKAMEPIITIRSKTAVLPFEDIDTDQIIPARFLTTTTKEGLGRHLFSDWRYADRKSTRLNSSHVKISYA